MTILAKRPLIALAVNFERFIKNIRPIEKRLKAAREYPKLVRDFLESTSVLETVEPHTRLTGSYGRQIAIHEIKDVDFVVCLSRKYRSLGVIQALEDLRDALEELANELKDKLGKKPEVDLRPQRRSVRVHFVEDDFYLDIVPVLLRDDDVDGVEGLLEVPDREWQSWQPTACVRYGRVFSDLNADADGKLIPLMMTLKHWRARTLKRNQAKSFWIEALVIELVRTEMIDFKDRSLAEVTAMAFAAIQARCAVELATPDATPAIPDPVISALNPNVAHNWVRADFETFMRRVDEAVLLSAAAIAATTSEEAIKAWQRLLGEEWFPASIEEEAKSARALAFAGTALVDRTGMIHSGTPSTGQRTTPSKPHVNHGGRALR